MASFARDTVAVLCNMVAVGLRANILDLPADASGPPRVLRRAKRASRVDASTAWALLKQADEKRVPPWIALRVGDQNLYRSLDETRSKQWGRLRVAMAMEKTSAAFRSCRQLSVAFDPSTYNGEDTAVAVAYTWRNQSGSSVAGYCPIKAIPPNKHIGLQEIRMTEEVKEIVAARRQTRWAAYKEGRALSSMVKDITGEALETFVLPGSWVVRPISQGEARLFRRGVAHRLKVDLFGNIEYCVPELPLDLMSVVIPLLVLCIDQGGMIHTRIYTHAFTRMYTHKYKYMRGRWSHMRGR